MEYIRRMMGAEIALDVAQQPFGLVAAPLDHLHTQPLQRLRQRLRPGRRRAILRIALAQNKIRHRLDRHQADLGMVGLVLTDADASLRHLRRQRLALLLSIGDHRLLQRGVEFLLAAVGTCHERRQAA